MHGLCSLAPRPIAIFRCPIANRAIPRVDGVKTSATSVKSLKDIAEVIANINNTMIVEASVPNPAAPGSLSVDGSVTFKIDGFSNF